MTPRGLCEKIGMSEQQLHQYIGPNPTRNVGNTVAHRIEDSLGYPRYWMDSEDDDVVPAGTKGGLPPHRVKLLQQMVAGVKVNADMLDDQVNELHEYVKRLQNDHK